MLIKYISVCKQEERVCPLKAVMLISVVWELTSSDEILHRPVNKYTLNRHLCNNYKGIMKECVYSSWLFVDCLLIVVCLFVCLFVCCAGTELCLKSMRGKESCPSTIKES